MSELYSSILASRAVLQTHGRAGPAEARWRRRHCLTPTATSPLFIRRSRCSRRVLAAAAAPGAWVGRPPWGFRPRAPQADTVLNPFYRLQGGAVGPGPVEGPWLRCWPCSKPTPKPLAAHCHSPPCSAPSRGSWGDPAPQPPLQPRCRQPPGARRGERHTATAPARLPPLCLPGEKSPGGRRRRWPGTAARPPRHGLMSLSLLLKVTAWCVHVFHVRYIKYNTTMHCTFPRQPSCHFRLTHSLLRKNAALGIYKAFQLNGHKSQVSFKPNNHWP